MILFSVSAKAMAIFVFVLCSCFYFRHQAHRLHLVVLVDLISSTYPSNSNINTSSPQHFQNNLDPPQKNFTCKLIFNIQAHGITVLPRTINAFARSLTGVSIMRMLQCHSRRYRYLSLPPPPHIHEDMQAARKRGARHF